MKRTDKICGKCKYHTKPNLPFTDWTCDNPQSDCYGLESEYSDSCEDWKERLTTN